MAARHVDSAGQQIVAYDVASADDNPRRPEAYPAVTTAMTTRHWTRESLAAPGWPDPDGDAHLLDGGSATLVHQLALTGAATALVTARSGETAPDPVVALWKDALAERIEVAVLPDACMPASGRRSR
jgi:hypothetical protein